MRIEMSSQVHAGAELEAPVSRSGLTLDDMPNDVVIHIVRSDPNASWNLAVASRRYEVAVLAGVLAPLLSHFSKSVSETRSYVSKAMRVGRTPAQIVAMSDAMSMRDTEEKARQLIRAGMYSRRVCDALCAPILQFLCQPRVLLYAFNSDARPLIWDDEIVNNSPFTGHEDIPLPERREFIRCDTKNVYVSGLDRLLLEFMDTLGEDAISQFVDSQFGHQRTILNAEMDPCGSMHERRGVYRKAEDARIVAVSLLRYLPSAKGVPYMMGRVLFNGPLHPIVRSGQPFSVRPRITLKEANAAPAVEWYRRKPSPAVMNVTAGNPRSKERARNCTTPHCVLI